MFILKYSYRRRVVNTTAVAVSDLAKELNMIYSNIVWGKEKLIFLPPSLPKSSYGLIDL